ncbi:uncharacterized protein LY79DRAFT_666489 [Colletotrichum navitas]|uniref:Uncharacterized protein n=1 Tax=Colletotrichum navitas TaxID=681940 RepID=A0AAD8Q9U9_9PEZI|nr:uncharacterized protein LY79DRAFT_666489 [Colletotrichum navitas]KAK1597657.1 hypothetical protein LY79DRAFT_666489 [Colletotrichum navitas]
MATSQIFNLLDLDKSESGKENRGQFCGLVGPSDAWKSTIMALVQRMYTRGADIPGLFTTSFRDDIAVVP